MTQDMRHMGYLTIVAAMDVDTIQRKEATYMGSWKRRGGVGAWMMATRKSDRMETMLRHSGVYTDSDHPERPPRPVGAWDIFAHIAEDPSGADGSVLAELRDLRQYLMLIEAEMMAQGHITPPTLPPPTPHQPPPATADPVPAEDSNRHAIGDIDGDNADALPEEVHPLPWQVDRSLWEYWRGIGSTEVCDMYYRHAPDVYQLHEVLPGHDVIPPIASTSYIHVGEQQKGWWLLDRRRVQNKLAPLVRDITANGLLGIAQVYTNLYDTRNMIPGVGYRILPEYEAWTR